MSETTRTRAAVPAPEDPQAARKERPLPKTFWEAEHWVGAALPQVSELVARDQAVGASIALALWRAVCAPPMDMGSPAASAFAAVVVVGRCCKQSCR